MRRDYSSEILVAIGAISVLVFAVAFAVILIVSQQANLVPTATPLQGVIVTSPTLGATNESAVTLAASATTTTVPSTLTQDSTTPSATVTPRVATTEAPTSTSSPIPPSATRSLPSATATQRAATTVASNTASPPSATATLRASATVPPSATNTSVPPSATPTATFTPSATPVPPTATPTNTASPTLTPSPAPTNTPTSSPTATLPPATPTPFVSASGCPVPAGWVAYTVQEGDTLFSLARISGITVSDIRMGNCLPDDTIFALQTLYLPLPGSNTVATGGVDGCNAAGVRIDPALVGQAVSSVFEVRGTANIDNFAYYRLEVLPPGANAYVEVRRGFRPVVDGVLARVSATRFVPGAYRLRLVVVDARGGFPQPCDIPVIIQ